MRGKRYCTNCGQESHKKHCLQCGVKQNKTHNYCQWCGSQLGDNATLCTHCMEPVNSSKWVHVMLAPIKYIFVLFAFMNIVDGDWGYALAYLLAIYCSSKTAYKHLMFLTLERPSIRKVMKSLRVFIVAVVLLLVGLHVPCVHEWEEATCSAPKTCSLCGETAGKVLLHQWEEATCGTAKKCKLCQITEGEPTQQHTWVPATCKAPTTCSVCELTQGESLEHTPGDWDIGTTDYVSATFRKELRCTECRSLLDHETVSLDTIHEDGIFILSPDEFGERMDDAVKTVASLLRSSKEWMAKTGAVNGSLVTAVGADYKDMGVVIYSDKKGVMDTTKQHTRGIDLIGLKILTNDTESMSTAMIAAVMACDPSLTTEEAAKVISEVTERYESKTGYTLNGITYMVIAVDNAPCLMAS